MKMCGFAAGVKIVVAHKLSPSSESTPQIWAWENWMESTSVKICAWIVATKKRQIARRKDFFMVFFFGKLSIPIYSGNGKRFFKKKGKLRFRASEIAL